MKAVLIAPTLAANSGGVERFCSLLQAMLESAGWQTGVVAPDVELPVAVHRLGLGPSLEAISAVRRARAGDPDLVISNGFLGGPTGCPRIHVFHGTMIRHVFATGAGSRWYRCRQGFGGAIPEALSGLGATTVAVSRSTAAEVRRLYRQRVDAVIPNCIDTELFSPGDRTAARDALGLDRRARYALFVGRFERRKGAELVPEACRRGGFELLIAGAGAPPSTKSLGSLAPAQLVNAYRAADCVVLPSRYEACSLVALETIACGVPLITTEVGWVRDFLAQCPDYRRLVVTPDVDSITRGLSNLSSAASAPLLTEARERVSAGNGLSVFRREWLDLISSALE